MFSWKGDIWSAQANGSDRRRLSTRAGPEFDPSWSPDGSRIAYRDSRRGINNNDEIYVMRSNGTHVRNLTRTRDDNEWSPSWSPDGKLIAFYRGELWVMRPNGTAARAITTVEGEYPAWSPDGQRIAFMSAQSNAAGPDPNYDVVVVDRDGSHLRKLTNWPGEDGWPAWSPNGKTIAFTSTREAGGPGRVTLYLMKADGSHKRRLIHGLSGAYPVWSPGGHMLMFSGTRSSGADDDSLWVVRSDGSGLRKLPLKGWLVDWKR
ncbi:MAG: TolB family protein [Gaiellaceae bacterium]